MKLRATRARLIATSALGLGISLVLAAATLISRHFIESTASHSRAPVLRPAAVFAPSVSGEGAGDKEIDAVSGFVPQAASEDARPTHAPAPVPEELLLSLAPPADDPDPSAVAAPGASAATGVPPRSRAVRTNHAQDPPPASTAPAEPRLEMIDENLWRP